MLDIFPATMILSCVLLLFPQAILGFEWLSAGTLPTGTTIPSCTGMDVTLGWKYQAGTEEHLTNAEWHFTPQGGGDVVLATEVLGNFFAAASSSLHLQYIPNAGIRLHNVNSSDAGTYSVHVNLNVHGSVVVEEQNVHLEVNDDSLTTDGQLHVRMSPDAAYDNTTKEFNVMLSCGNFKPVWGTRVTMIWKTPDNRSLPSTSFDNGVFYLAVPNPVVGGEYTCLIDQSSPATLCVRPDSQVQRGATVSVDGDKVRFAIMEARLKAQQLKQAQLETLLTAQAAKNSALETRMTLLQATEEALVQENAHLRQQVDAATASAAALQNKLQTAVKQVFFMATPSQPKDLSANIMNIFDHEEMDVGGGYNPSTGYFTAPVSGLYLFMVTVDVDTQSGGTVATHVGVSLHADGQRTTSDAWAGLASSGSTRLVTHLAAGQRAYVTPVPSSELVLLGSRSIGKVAAGAASSFSGVLIQADV